VFHGVARGPRVGNDGRALRSLFDLRLLVVVAPAALAAVVACGGSSSTAPSAPTTPFTVWVFDEGSTIADEGAPLPGVTVALDAPAGGAAAARVVKTTEADGHVTFDADLSHGGLHVSAFSADHTLVTMLDASPDTARARPNTFGKPAEDLAIVLPRLDATIRSSTVELRGAIAGKRDLADALSLSAGAVRRIGQDETKAATYAIRAPKNVPFVVLGHEAGTQSDTNGTITFEHVKSFRLDLPARAADEVLDIDVAASPALAMQPLHLRADIPTGNASPFVPGTRASAIVQSADSSLLVGTFGSITATSDALGFDLVVNVAQTDIAPERVTTQASIVAPDGTTSIRTELGIAADKTVWSDFLFPAPVDSVNQSISDPVPLAGFPAGADLRLEVYAADQLVWILRGPPDGPHADSVTMPPPLGIDFPIAVQLVALLVIAQADRVPLPPHGELYRRVAVSHDVILRRN
jgi:hypothetical protein